MVDPVDHRDHLRRGRKDWHAGAADRLGAIEPAFPNHRCARPQRRASDEVIVTCKASIVSAAGRCASSPVRAFKAAAFTSLEPVVVAPRDDRMTLCRELPHRAYALLSKVEAFDDDAPFHDGNSVFSRSTVWRHLGVFGAQTLFWLPNMPTS